MQNKCAGNQISRATSEIHSAESFESLESDHVDLDNLGRLSFKKTDDREKRQADSDCPSRWVIKKSYFSILFLINSYIRMPA